MTSLNISNRFGRRLYGSYVRDMQTIDNIHLGEVHGEEDSGRTRAGLGAESRAAGST